MKTLTTTLSIFALLLSTSAFSAVSNEDITPPTIKNDRPPFSNNINLDDITPPTIKNDRNPINF